MYYIIYSSIQKFIQEFDFNLYPFVIKGTMSKFPFINGGHRPSLPQVKNLKNMERKDFCFTFSFFVRFCWKFLGFFNWPLLFLWT